MKKAFLLILISLLVITSCTTVSRNEKFVEVDEYASNRMYEEAVHILEDPEEQEVIYPETDQVLKHLDIGMLHFYAGNHAKAQDHLSQAEYLMEEYFTTSISQAGASLLLNDTVMNYAGEPHEDLYANVFKAVSFLDDKNFDGAYVEIRRLNDKLNLLQDKYSELADGYNSSEDNETEISSGSTEFYNSALGRYISMIIYRADGNPDSARIDSQKFDQAFQTQGGVYDFPKPDISAMLEPAGDMARLNVISFTGNAPEKRANTLFIKTFTNEVLVVLQYEDEDGNFVTEDVESMYWPNMESGYQFKFQLPYMVKMGSDVKRISVNVDGTPVGELDLIESIENVAYETYKLKEPIIYLKTITRTIVKGLINKAAQDAADDAAAESGNTGFMVLSLVGGLVADVAVAESEQADLRTARFYPGFAYGGEFLIPEGQHVVSIEYYDGWDNLLFTEVVDEKEYKAGKLNLVSAYAPR